MQMGESMLKVRGVAVVATAALLLSACAGGSNLVVNPNRSTVKTEAVELVYEGGTVNVPDQATAELKRYMDEAFFKKTGMFARGSGITVKYGFMSFDEGSRAARYFLGPIGGGEAKMVIGAEFFDTQGNSLAKIQSEGRLSGGLLGGDSSSAIKKAAEEVANYAKANFGK